MYQALYKQIAMITAMIAGIDRVLDMFRTTVNITGDGAVACVVDKSERENAAWFSGKER